MVKKRRIASFPTLGWRRWKRRRLLERELELAHQNYQVILHNPNKTKQALLIATWEYQQAMWALDQHKSWAILLKAERLALDVPTPQEKPSWWRDDSEFEGEALSHWLSEKGRTGVSNLVRNERRNTWEWRIKIITPILTIVVGILGLVVALVSLLAKSQ